MPIAHLKAFLFDLAPNATGRIQLARTGSFYRQDQGNFSVTKKMLEMMAANAVERGVDIPIKLTHDGGTYAAGWVAPASLQVVPWGSFYGLFGVPRWDDVDVKAAGVAGKLKYTSPEIVWNDRRMADSKRGKAGEPIGPMICAIALVLDPFFTMDPVVFSRLPKASTPKPATRLTPRSYSMLTIDQARTQAEALIKSCKGDIATLDSVALQLMADANGAPSAEEPMPEEIVAAAEETPVPEEEPVAAAAGYSKDPVVAALQKQSESQAKELAGLRKAQEAQAKKDRDVLYAEFSRDGRLRNADAKESRELLDKHGEQAFRAAYGRNPKLVGITPPPAPTAAPATFSNATASEPLKFGTRTLAAAVVTNEEVKAYQAQHPSVGAVDAMLKISAQKKAGAAR